MGIGGHASCQKRSTFIFEAICSPTTLTLCENDPEYVSTLMAMLPIEQERLLHGNWGNITEGLVYPERL